MWTMAALCLLIRLCHVLLREPKFNQGIEPVRCTPCSSYHQLPRIPTAALAQTARFSCLSTVSISHIVMQIPDKHFIHPGWHSLIPFPSGCILVATRPEPIATEMMHST